MFRAALLICSLFLVNSAFSCTEIAESLLPKTDKQFIDLCRSEFQIAYSLELKSPLWTGALLTKEEMERPLVRKNLFRADPTLASEQKFSVADYPPSRVTGYDKGHMFSAGDASTALGQAESFYLSNMVPQASVLNRGAWKQLELNVRNYAVKENEIYVFTGPIYSAEPVGLGPKHIPIPKELFKIVYNAKTNTVATVIVPNTEITNITEFISNLATVKNKTGIEFLTNQHPIELSILPF